MLKRRKKKSSYKLEIRREITGREIRIMREIISIKVSRIDGVILSIIIKIMIREN